jgi:hypothetical protein
MKGKMHFGKRKRKLKKLNNALRNLISAGIAIALNHNAK